MTTKAKQPLFDVVAVTIQTGRMRILAERKTEDNAEAIVKMAVIRRGVEVEFYKTVPTGTVKEGDVK